MTSNFSESAGYSLAKAGHIAPQGSGREADTPQALPLCLVPDQTGEPAHGRLAFRDRCYERRRWRSARHRQKSESAIPAESIATSSRSAVSKRSA